MCVYHFYFRVVTFSLCVVWMYGTWGVRTDRTKFASAQTVKMNEKTNGPGQTKKTF